MRCIPLSAQSLRVRWEPPPPEHRNGLIEGYKVYYKQTGHFKSSEPEIKKTTNLETSLHGLTKYANYSVRVLAFTSAGEGVRSSHVHCMTDEDGSNFFPPLRGHNLRFLTVFQFRVRQNKSKP